MKTIYRFLCWILFNHHPRTGEYIGAGDYQVFCERCGKVFGYFKKEDFEEHISLEEMSELWRDE